MKKLILIFCLPLFVLCLSLFYIEVSSFSIDPDMTFWEKFKHVSYKSPLFYMLLLLLLSFFFMVRKQK